MGSSPVARTLIGSVVLIWIALLSLVSLRFQADGPVWGIEFRASPDGSSPIISSVEQHTTGWGAELRPGMRILRVGDEDARAYVDRPLPPAPHLTYIDVSGAERTAYAGISPAGMLALLITAFGCAGLGVVVHRWSPDLTLGRLFLLFTGSVGSGLAAVPFGTMRYPWTLAFMSVVSALVPISFLLVTLYFPRRVRGAKPVALALAVLAVLLATVGVVSELSGERSDLVQRCLSLWFAGNLVGGTIMLIGRALRPDQRPDLIPIGIGWVVGFSPYVLLNAVPSLIQGRPIVGGDVSGLALIAVPLSFAYAILRYRFLALDALLRRLITRTSIVALIVGSFLAIWLALQQLGVDIQTGGVIAAVAAALAGPIISRHTRDFLDGRLYPRIDPALSSKRLYESGTVLEVGSALTSRVRDLLPVQWAACATVDTIGPSDTANDWWSLVALQGLAPDETPTTFHVQSKVTRFGTSVVVPIGHAGITLGALIVGARLDGTSVGNRELGIVRQFAERTAVLLELALRRAQEADEDSYRVGLGDFRRALITCPSREATITTIASYTQRLLGADEVVIWGRQPNGALALEASAGEAALGTSADEEVGSAGDLLGPEMVRHLTERRVVRVEGTSHQRLSAGYSAHMLAFTIGIGDDRGYYALVLATRSSVSSPFGNRHERRALEIAEHAQILTKRGLASIHVALPAPIAALTPREREIAALVAQGLTNRQISHQLCIAERTAGKHLENLTAKLGFQSRVQVATWAIEHGLVTAMQQAPGPANGHHGKDTENSV